MPPLPLLAILLLLCLRIPRAVAAAADPTPTPWPHQFYAVLVMVYRRNTSLVSLSYDWPGGRSLHEIRYVLAPDTPYHHAEWNNGTAFFYSPERRACRSVEAGGGILRPDWFATGAAYLGRARCDWSDCHVWSKDNFTYYEDARTRRPDKWVFHTGRTVHVTTFDPGAWVPEDVGWQAPAYCFAKEDDGTAKNILISELKEVDDGSFIPMIRMLRGD